MAGSEMTTFWTTSLSVTKPHFAMSQSSDVTSTSRENARQLLLGGSATKDRRKLQNVNARKRLREVA
jgi:hypothetical protein